MKCKMRTLKPVRSTLIRCKLSLFCAFFLLLIAISVIILVEKYCKIMELSHLEIILRHQHLDEQQKIVNAQHCFQPKDDRIYNHIKLLDDVLIAGKTPQPGNTIFFHETSCTSNGLVALNARQACAIESAARWHKNRDIFVIFAANVGLGNESVPAVVKVLQSYPNVQLRNVNLSTYASQTPFDEWLRSDRLYLSRYLNAHTSDLMRYLSMLNFGGIHLDLDVVVQRSFDTLPTNFAAAESTEFVAVGAIGFDFNGNGHEIAELCAREFVKSFNGKRWGHNGPGVLTRVLKNICQVEHTNDMTADKCWGFSVLPQTTFYAIDSKDWHMFFNASQTTETLRRTNNSTIVHVWNKRSNQLFIHKGRRKTAYEIIARKHCPKVFQATDEHF